MISENLKKVKALIKENKKKAILILLVLAAIFPHLTDNNYFIYIGVTVVLYMILASALNIILGYTFQYLIGFAGFFAIGAYTTAILSTRTEINFLIILLISGFMCSIFSILLGIPTYRLGGIFFAFASLGFGEIIRLTIINWETLTRGTFGIPGIPSPEIFNLQISTNTRFFYFGLIILILHLFMSYRIINSRVGRAWISLRENEAAAKSMGVDTLKYKLLNLMYGTFWAGIGGGFYAYFSRYVSPDTFVLDEGFRIFAMVLVGGMGTLVGPLIGSGLLTLLPQIFREFSRYQLVIYGIAILLIMHYRPQGLFGDSRTNVNIEETKDENDDKDS